MTTDANGNRWLPAMTVRSVVKSLTARDYSWMLSLGVKALRAVLTPVEITVTADMGRTYEVYARSTIKVTSKLIMPRPIYWLPASVKSLPFKLSRVVRPGNQLQHMKTFFVASLFIRKHAIELVHLYIWAGLL